MKRNLRVWSILVLTILILGCGETKKETKYVEKELNPPKAPSGLVASAVSESQIDLSWVANSGNESRFELWRKTGGEVWGLVSELPADATTCSDTGLKAETEYFYQIRACNKDGCSSFSEIASATTQTAPLIAPDAPSGLSASALSSSQVLLTWQDNSDNEDGFKIERDDGTGFQEIATISANQTSYLDENLSPSTTYAYQVKAYNSAGESGYSNQAQTTTFDLTASCQGYCGGQGVGGCWCDQNCWDYGDCCSDVCEECGICSPNCVDADSDGYFTNPRCGTAVDCDDSDSTVYPGASELCDGKDNQCPGDSGYGRIDETCYWARTYGGSKNDEAYSVQQTSDGGYIVAGYTSSFGAGGHDVWILKLRLDGKEIWNKTYGGTAYDEAHSIQQTQDGGYIVAGATSSKGAGNYDFWILKLDDRGNLIWDKTYGGTADDSAHFIRQTQDGGFIVAGDSSSFASTWFAFWILKLDQDGNLVWDKVYERSGWDVATSIQQTQDGGYIVTGPSPPLDRGFSDVWIIKLNPNGDKVWEKTYEQTSGNEAYISYSVQQTKNGGYIVAAFVGGGKNDFWVLKLDENGDMVWDKNYGGTVLDGWDEIRAIKQTQDGNFIASGYSSSYAGGYYGSYDFWILKLDSTGNLIWNKSYGGNYDDKAYSIQQTLDGGYIIAGTTNSFGAGGTNILILKLDANGDCPGCF